jgi:preprotein translocase subunit SecY
VLRNQIYTASILGGAIIGFLTVLGDLSNAIGSSTGILLCCSSLYKYFEAVNEKQR